MSRSLSQVHEQKHGDIHNSPSDSKYTALIHTHNDVQAFEHKLFYAHYIPYFYLTARPLLACVVASRMG